ncbi:hypothetical protein Tco_1245861 [Tanacetum coccineum]
MRFRQWEREPIKDAWIRFQDLIRQAPRHGNRKWLLVQTLYDNISHDEQRRLDHFIQHRFINLNVDEGWERIEDYVQYQDDMWEEPSPIVNILSIPEIIKPTFLGRLNVAHEKLSYLTTLTRGKSLRNPYLICDICRGTHEVNECNSNGSREQVCLSGGDIYNDPSILRFYQNDDLPP